MCLMNFIIVSTCFKQNNMKYYTVRRDTQICCFRQVLYLEIQSAISKSSRQLKDLCWTYCFCLQDCLVQRLLEETEACELISNQRSTISAWKRKWERIAALSPRWLECFAFVRISPELVCYQAKIMLQHDSFVLSLQLRALNICNNHFYSSKLTLSCLLLAGIRFGFTVGQIIIKLMSSFCTIMSINGRLMRDRSPPGSPLHSAAMLGNRSTSARWRGPLSNWQEF